MQFSAQIQNSNGANQVVLRTGDHIHSIVIPPKSSGYGSSANGGELLFLAMAACYCNDIYREAAKRGIQVHSVEVKVTGEFGVEGEPARDVTYQARVAADAEEADILDLMRFTDSVAEIQNTLRIETPVKLSSMEVIKGLT